MPFTTVHFQCKSVHSLILESVLINPVEENAFIIPVNCHMT